MKHIIFTVGLLISVTLSCVAQNWNSKPIIIHEETVYALALNSNESLLASGSNDNKIVITNTSNNKTIKQWVGHSVGVKCLAFTNDNQYLISGGNDNVIKIWSTDNWKLVKEINHHKGAVNDIALHPSGSSFFACSNDKTISQWEMNTWHKLKDFVAHDDVVLSIDINNEGTLLVSTSGNRQIPAAGNLKIWSLDTVEIMFTLIEKTTAIQDADFSKSGSMVLYSGNFSYACLLKWRDNKIIAKKDLTPFSLNSIVLRGLNVYAVSTFSGKLIYWRIGDESQEYSGHKTDVNCVLVNKDKSKIYTGGADGKVLLWNNKL